MVAWFIHLEKRIRLADMNWTRILQNTIKKNISFDKFYTNVFVKKVGIAFLNSTKVF